MTEEHCVASLQKIQKMEAQMRDLKSDYEKALNARLEKITPLLKEMKLAHMEEAILVGAFLDIKEKSLLNDPALETWKKNGQKVLKNSKRKSRAKSKAD